MKRPPPRGAWPALGLFVLAPLVAEFLLGNLPITYLFALILLAPLYGGGALLIRELARQAGRGWPTILGLAVAYAVLEEGIVSMSLFNPNYAGEHLLDNGFIPLLGIGIPWTVRVISLHVVWSICVPIALVEVLAAPRGTEAWLGRRGFIAVAVVFAVGVCANAFVSVATTHFVASATQLAATALVVVVVALVALQLPLQPSRSDVGGSPPHPWLVGIGAFIATSAFKLLPDDWPAVVQVGITLSLEVLAAIATFCWSRQSGWNDRYRLALVAGAVLTYAWHSFLQTPQVPADRTVDVVGNAVFAVAAVGLLVAAAARVHQRERSSSGPKGAALERSHVPAGS